MEYVRMRKTALAKLLFLFTNRAVSEVAGILGYSERSYFSGVFKKHGRIAVRQLGKASRLEGARAAAASPGARRFAGEVFGVSLP